MAEPVPTQKVSVNFAMDKAAKRRYAGITTVIIVVLVGSVILIRRKQVEDPNKRAVEIEERKASAQKAPEVVGAGGNGVSVAVAQDQVGQDDVFLQSMQNFQHEQQEQRKAAEVQQREALDKAREDGLRQGQVVPGQRPPGVAPDGTATNQNQMQGPLQPEYVARTPRYDYSTQAWMPAGGGRVRPGYQTGEMWPSDPAKHSEIETRYWEGFTSALVVGVNGTDNTYIERLKQDTAGTKGSFGVKPQRVIEVSVPNVKTPAQPQPGSTWGGWITVTPETKPDGR